MKLALFDLDHTLLAGDSDVAWADFLIEKGLVEAKTHAEANARFYADYQAGTLDIAAFLDFQLGPLALHPRDALTRWHAEFMQTRILPLIHDEARALIARHAGELCAIVTATNSFVTGPIARELGVPHLIATIPATLNGAFTGKVQGTPAFREGKIARTEAWLESLGLWWSDFSATTFYSDSHNDLPLLEKVSNPVAVNPDDKLRNLAHQRHWPILVV